MGALLATNIFLVILVVVTGREFVLEDIGGVFEQANAVAEYAAERMAAAANGETLPEPPAILADLFLVKAGVAVTIAYQAALVVIVVFLSRQPIGRLARELNLDRFDFETLWRPAAVTFGAYVLLVFYSVVVVAIGPDFLEPKSTVPTEILRDDFAIVLTGVAALIGAPFAEEMFFRVLIFGGLLRWGFYPAAILSGLLFGAVHLDPGSLLPFTMIGVLLAWMFWRRGHLWDAIAFHLMFNATSFILLVSLQR
jgi:CAAX protease family protein